MGMQAREAFRGRFSVHFGKRGTDGDAHTPAHEFLDLLFDDGFHSGNFAFARFLVLLHDVGKLVYVVKKYDGEISDGGRDVAGHPQIDEQERTIPAPQHRAFRHFPREHRFFTQDRCNNEVGPLDRFGQLFPGRYFAIITARQFPGVILRTVNDAQMLEAAVAEMTDHLFACGARSNDQRPMSVEAAEYLLREFYTGERYRHGQRANPRFRSNTFADFEGALKQAIENLPARAPFKGIAVGGTHLAQNFRFSEQQGIKARAHTIEVTDHILIAI